MTFTSKAAALRAYNKAEKAWEAKRAEENAAASAIHRAVCAGGMPEVEYRATLAVQVAAAVEAKALLAAMRRIWETAQAQGIYIRSWQFEWTETDNLIGSCVD